MLTVMDYVTQGCANRLKRQTNGCQYCKIIGGLRPNTSIKIFISRSQDTPTIHFQYRKLITSLIRPLCPGI